MRFPNNRDIVTLNFDSILFHIPGNVANKFPTKYTYKTFPTNYCGAGKGVGELVVPDYIFGPTRFLPSFLDISIKISPACAIHDIEWELAEPTWDDFHKTNERFHVNLEEIIVTKARSKFILARAMYRPVTYLNAVTIVGKPIFWSIKAAQGFSIPKTAIINPDVVFLFEQKLSGKL